MPSAPPSPSPTPTSRPNTPSPRITISLTTLQQLQAKPTNGPYSLGEISALNTEWRSICDSTLISFNRLVTCKECHSVHAFTVPTKYEFEALCKEMKGADARKVGRKLVDVFLVRWERLLEMVRGEESGEGCERGHKGVVKGGGLYGWREEW